jgi:hypothetical protein
MKGEEPLDFSPSSVSVSSSHISVDNTESTLKIKPINSAASGNKYFSFHVRCVMITHLFLDYILQSLLFVC